MSKIQVISEIGLNHNGSMDLCKKLISASSAAGCDLVKFQKRDIDLCFTEEELSKEKEWWDGKTISYREYKNRIEFDYSDYKEIDRYCREVGIGWFASPWDENSVDTLAGFSPPFLKVASASVTDKGLLEHMCKTEIPLIVSTGMCDLPLIRKVVSFIEEKGGKIACLMHCTSTYPSQPEELNLLGIRTLQMEFPHLKIGYSGHETQVPTAGMACALGARMIERHITLDRSMWGSDQAASLMPVGMAKVVNDARLWERVCGDGNITVYESEKPIEAKLRRKNDFV